MISAAQALQPAGPRNKSYANCLAASKRIRWDIDRDVIRGRRFDHSKKFLPDGLSRVWELDFLSDDEQRLLSQIRWGIHPRRPNGEHRHFDWHRWLLGHYRDEEDCDYRVPAY